MELGFRRGWLVVAARVNQNDARVSLWIKPMQNGIKGQLLTVGEEDDHLKRLYCSIRGLVYCYLIFEVSLEL